MDLGTGGVRQSNINALGDVAANDIHKYSIDNSTKNFFEAARLLPSNLAVVVNALGKRLPEEDTFIAVEDFSIEHKKDYNNVQVYRYIMDEYGLLVGKLMAVYDECDSSGTNITFNTLGTVRLAYLKARGECMASNPQLTMIEVVRMFSDEIFEKVEQRLLTNVVSSANILESMESVHLSLQVIMIDAFIRCKILEHPTQNAVT
jgi:hypothetical protein